MKILSFILLLLTLSVLAQDSATVRQLSDSASNSNPSSSDVTLI